MIRREQSFAGDRLRVHVDERDLGGAKKWEWVKKGVPIRLEIGPRDIESRKVCVQRRDRASNEKEFVDREEFLRNIPEILGEIQARVRKEPGARQLVAVDQHPLAAGFGADLGEFP